jgi:hypothetical protein
MLLILVQDVVKLWQHIQDFWVESFYKKVRLNILVINIQFIYSISIIYSNQEFLIFISLNLA